MTDIIMFKIHILHMFFQLLFLSWFGIGSIYTSGMTNLENQAGL